MSSTKKLPAAKDFDSVVRTLLSNARSDGGASLTLVQHAEFDKSTNGELFWSAAHLHSDVSGNHFSLGDRHLAKAGEMNPDADWKQTGNWITMQPNPSTSGNRSLSPNANRVNTKVTA